MNYSNSGAESPQGGSPQHHDRKVRLLLALLLVLGATLAFMSTSASERMLGVKLSGLFSGASKVEYLGPPICDQQGTVPCREECKITDQCGTQEIQNDADISIVNPQPNATWAVGQTYAISWNSPPRAQVAKSYYSLRLESGTATACSTGVSGMPICEPNIMIVDRAEDTGSTKWTVPANLPAQFFTGTSNLILIIDNKFRTQTQVQIVKSKSDPGDEYPTGTYIRLLSDPTYVFRMGNGAKHPLPHPAQEIMTCLGLNPANIRDGLAAHERIPESTPVYCNPTSPRDFRNNIVVGGIPSTPFGSIYLLKDRQLRLIPNMDTLKCLGFTYSQVRIATRSEAGLEPGKPLSCTGTTAGTLSLTGDGTLPIGTVGVPYSARITATGGVAPYSFAIGSVNPGANVKIDNSGQITATFVAAGTYRINVQVTDSGTNSTGGVSRAEKTYVVTINHTTPPVTASNCVGGPINSLVALHRYYSASDTDHYYSTNANAPTGFVSEGITAYVYPTQAAGTVALYQSYNPERREHYYTTDMAGTQSFGYRLDGIVGYVYPTQVAGSSPLYRMYNHTTKHYLLTSSTVERDAILNLGFVQQGFAGYTCGTPRPGSEIMSVYRLWNPTLTDHLYTTRPDERDSALKRGYVSEGIAGNVLSVPGNDRVPVYRLWSAKFGDHFYTTSEAEAKASGYAREGIIGFIYQSPSSGRVQLYRLNNSKIGNHFYTTQTSERDAAIRSGYKFEGTMGYLP